MATLRLREVEKSFGTVRVLRGVDLDVPAGKLLALVGPSGCGKTTTLRLIAGFDRPDRGEIEVDGQSLLGCRPEERGIGFVFQGYALFPHLSVFRNVAYGLRFLSRAEREARVRELVALVGLTGLDRRRSAELSAGQRQRVALARALAPRPRLLLLDEPLSALDVPLRETLRGEVRRIQQELALSTVYVTHDQGEALSVSDRVAVMNEGRIEQEGSPRDVYERPRTPFVASSVGRSNRLDGQVVRVEGETIWTRVGGAEIPVPDGQLELAAGDGVLLFVKEEHVRVVAEGRGLFVARVVSSDYHGDAVTVHLEAPVGRLRAWVPTKEADRLRRGERVGVDLPQERISAFPVGQEENPPVHRPPSASASDAGRRRRARRRRGS